jgi:two-component system response regulator
MRMGEAEILLVADSAEEAALTIGALRREKLANNIMIAGNEKDALDYLFCRGDFVHRSFDRPPTLVLIDLEPQITGIEILKQVKADARTKIIPVVILISSTKESELIDGYNLGANSYVHKALDLDQFHHTLKTLASYWMIVNHSPSAYCGEANGMAQ